MKYIVRLLLFFMLIFSTLSYSGKSIEMSKSQEKRFFKKTMKLVYKGHHKHAESNLLKLLEMDSANVDYNYELGLLYYYDLFQTDKSLKYFYRVERMMNKDEYPEIYFYIGQSLQFMEAYDDAIKNYTYFKQFIPENDDGLLEEVMKFTAECNVAKKLEQDKKTRIRNLGNRINTNYSEYVPVPVKEDKLLLFTSKRPKIMSTHYGFEGKVYYEKVYLSEKSGSKYSFAEISSNQDAFQVLENSKKWHNAVVSSTHDGQVLIIYKRNKLWTSQIKDGVWQVPEKVSKIVNFSFYQPHATMSQDGSAIYFSSWSKKGFGGIDIYRSVRNKDGKWSPVENLGAEINTKYNEDSPEITPDGKTLYFSSKGHNNAGGYDIFRSDFVDNKWTEPVNLGFPINSPGDDIFFKFNTKGDLAYFSSYRKDGFGNMDIYAAVFGPQFEDCQPVEDKSPLADLYVGFTAMDTVVVGDEVSFDASVCYAEKYKFTKYFWSIENKEIIDQVQVDHKFECEGNYEVNLEVETVDIETKEAAAYCVRKNITVIPESVLIADNSVDADTTNTNLIVDTGGNNDIPNGTNNPPSALSLGNVYFGFDKSGLREDAKMTLDENIKMLKEYKDAKIKVVAHTDSRGSGAYNQILSERRASSVKEYLIANGIDTSRIIEVVGKGESELVNNCKDKVLCSKEDHQKNRRAELIVIY